MEKINIKITAPYLSIQEGFEWNNIPPFAIITGINGAGKTHLLSILQNDNNIDIISESGATINLVLSSQIKSQLNIEGLITYKNNIIQRLVKIKELDDKIKQYNRWKDNINISIKHTSDKIQLQKLYNDLRLYEGWLKNNIKEKKEILIYAYEKELENILLKTGKREIEEILDSEIWEYANPYFNTLSEIQDFERFIRQEEANRNELFVKLAKEYRENEIPKIREQERAFERINRLFRKYGFEYFKMLDPFPSDKSRNGEVLFKGLKDELVQYSSLSSGEQMIVKFIIWAMSTDFRGNRINTMILDEPDAHLHPSMCKMMVEILQEISHPKDFGGSDIRVIITTHSPSTVAFAPEGSLFIMDKDENNNRYIKKTTTEEAVSILSEGIFTFEKAINKFTLIANSEKNNILFVEGKTDINHFKRAIEILGYDLDLDVFELHDAGALANFIRSTPAKLCDGKKLIALFDCDNEGKKSFKSINGDIVFDNVQRVKATQCEKMSFAITLQAPDKLEQYCPIEFLYPYDYLKSKSILRKMDFREYKNTFKGENPLDDKLLNDEFEKESSLRPYKVNDDEKNRFSESIKTETDRTLFENFRPTIELIKKIINFKP